MPFKSQAQMRAAFAGGLGPEMQAKAHEWARETPDIKHLPRKIGKAHHVKAALVKRLKG
jgi:hypothetical protein